MGSVRALLFTQGEAGIFNPVPFDLFKENFDASIYKLAVSHFRSEQLELDINSLTMEIEGTQVFALAFSDGTIYDTYAGWRNVAPDKEWVDRIYAEKI